MSCLKLIKKKGMLIAVKLKLQYACILKNNNNNKIKQ